MAEQLAAAVRAVFAPVAAYLNLVTRNNPHGGAGGLLGRPDVRAQLGAAFDEAWGASREAVQSAWTEAGPVTTGLLPELLQDVNRAYNAQAMLALEEQIRAAWEAVPNREFVPGVTEPGANPSREAAHERGQAVQDAVEAFARHASLRNELSENVAAGMAQTEAELEGAPGGARKRWRAHVEKPACCFWCRRLNGITIPVGESFAHHVGLPADLTGHGHLTQPPKPYHGWLQGPRLHPHCQCWLEIIEEGEEPEDVSQPRESSGFISSSDIKALPEGKYRALVEFLKAAEHELAQVLHRLGKVIRRGR